MGFIAITEPSLEGVPPKTGVTGCVSWQTKLGGGSASRRRLGPMSDVAVATVDKNIPPKKPEEEEEEEEEGGKGP